MLQNIKDDKMILRSISIRERKRYNPLIKDVELKKWYIGKKNPVTEKVGFVYVEPCSNDEIRHNRLVRNHSKKKKEQLNDSIFIDTNFYIGKHSSFSDFLDEEINCNDKIIYAVKYYKKFLIDRGLPATTEWYKVTQNHLLDFQYYLNNEALKVNGELISQHTAIKYFDKILGQVSKAVYEGYLDKKPIPDKMIKRNYPEVIKEYLNLHEVYKFHKLEVATPKEKLIRDSFVFGCHTALRPSDIIGLKKKDISTNLKGVQSGVINMFKTKKNVGVYISDELIQLTNEYMDANPESEFLFPELKYNNELNKALKRLAFNAGVNSKITFGCGRHSFVNIQLAHGVSPETISIWLGHKSLNSIRSYVNTNNHDFNMIRNNALSYKNLDNEE